MKGVKETMGRGGDGGGRRWQAAAPGGGGAAEEAVVCFYRISPLLTPLFYGGFFIGFSCKKYG